MSGNLLEELGWAPGDRCYAQYSEDNLWYPAIIMKEEKGYVFVLWSIFEEGIENKAGLKVSNRRFKEMVCARNSGWRSYGEGAYNIR